MFSSSSLTSGATSSPKTPLAALSSTLGDVATDDGAEVSEVRSLKLTSVKLGSRVGGGTDLDAAMSAKELISCCLGVALLHKGV